MKNQRLRAEHKTNQMVVKLKLVSSGVTSQWKIDGLAEYRERKLSKLGYIGEINSLNDVVVDQMHQLWRTFAALINKSLFGKTIGLDKLCLSRAQILWDKAISWRNKIGTHTSKDDYLINTLRFVSAKEATQIYGVVLPESLTSPEMKETKAYKTYLGFTTGATPPKKARKFKKPASPQLSIVPVSPEEPTRKSKSVKRPAKNSTKAPARGVVIRETPKMPLSKKKEKMTVEKRKGIDLLSEVALTDEARYEEVRRKILRDFHKTHPSGSGTVTKTAPSVIKIKPSVSNEGTSVKPGVPDVTEEESFEKNEEDIGDDEEEVKDEFVKTPSNDSDDEDKTKITNKAKGDEDEVMDYTTSQLDDDVDIRLNKPIQADDEMVQKEDTDAELANKTGVLVTSSSHSSDLASNFLNFSDIPHTDAEIFFSNGCSPLEKDVFELKKDDPLKTQVTALVDEHLDARLVATRDEFMNYLLTLITLRITEQVKIQLPQILPKEVSNFAPPEIQLMVTKSLEQAILAKESSQPQSSYEAAAMFTEFKLKKILIDKMDKSESYLAAPEHRECYKGLIKSYDLNKTLFSTYDKVYSLKRNRKDKDKDEDPSAGSDRGLKKRKTSKDAEPTKEEPEFKVADSDMPQDQEGNLGNDDDEPMKETLSKAFDELMSTPIDFSVYIMNCLKITNLTQETLLGPAFKLLKGTRTNYVELEYDFEECYKAFSEKLDWENPEGGDYPFDLTKLLPLVMSGNRISHWREQRKTFYGYARGLESRHDVYSTKRILAVTQVEVIRKHGYGYLKEIVVRRADNDLYRFKEGDFPCLYINDIEDMLLLVVQNRLKILSGDDVSDFAIALRMFTRSLVIQKRVEDLQLEVVSYQKKINVTKPETTRPGLRKRDPFTPYQDPQGFIYVDNQERNSLMRSDELYKFSDGTLTRLLTSLEDFTNNINTKYLPKRTWS
ncbi:hypothetical protein Tco_0151114 [Tanacetum coccineum]